MEKTLYTLRRLKQKRMSQLRTQMILAAGFASILYAGYPVVKNTVMANDLKEQQQQALNELEGLNNEKKELEYLVLRLQDEEYLMKVARDSLNLSKKDEIIINLPTSEDKHEEDEDKAEFNVVIPDIKK